MSTIVSTAVVSYTTNGLISRAVKLTAAVASSDIMMWAWRTVLPHKQVQCDIT